MKFVGIDLAWSETHPSGVAVIDSKGTVTRASAKLTRNTEIYEFGDIRQGGGAVVTIDAPLIVRNADRCRPLEDRLTDLFWPYDAGPYPANLSNPAFQPSGRITALVQQLTAWGFVQRTTALHEPEERTLIEVFPVPLRSSCFPLRTDGSTFTAGDYGTSLSKAEPGLRCTVNGKSTALAFDHSNTASQP